MTRALALLLVFCSPLVAAEEAPSPPTPESLARAVDELRKQVAADEQAIAQQRDEIAALKRETEAARANKSGVFRVGGLKVSLFGFLQADGVLYDQASVDEVDPSTGQPLNAERFLIRRGRIAAQADYGIVSGVLELDGNTINGATARITNGEVTLKWPSREKGAPPLLAASIGLLRIPFGFEVIQKDYVRLFLERSNVIRAFFPGEYDLGIRLAGGWRFARYAIAALNGNPSGDRQFAARDPTSSKDFVGRLGIDTTLGTRFGIAGGLSALYGTGFHQGTPAGKNSIQWRDLNNDGQVDPTELEGVVGQAQVASRTFQRYAFGGDVEVSFEVPRLGPLEVYAELVWAQNLDRALAVADPIAAGRALRELGWYIAATQSIGSWASVGIRYDRYDPDQDARERQAANIVARDLTFSTLAIAAAVEWRPYARLTLEWDHNTNALGRAASGAPTTLDADAVTLRGQLVF